MCKAIHTQSKHSGAEEMPNVGGGIIQVMTDLRELSAGNEFEPGPGRMPYSSFSEGRR